MSQYRRLLLLIAALMVARDAAAQSPAATVLQPAGTHSVSAALAAHVVSAPSPVAAAVAVPAAANQLRDSYLAKLHVVQSPLATRDVVVMAGSQVVRLTDANAGSILSQPTLTAERLGTMARRLNYRPAFLTDSTRASAAFALPTQFTALAVQSNQPVNFNIVLAILDALHYDPAAGKFAGRLAMALVNPANHDDVSALSHEVPVLVGANGADFTPESLKFTQLNAPQELRLLVLAPTEPYAVEALTALNRNPDSIVVPVLRPGIEVRPVSNRIRGLGLEQTTLIIRVPEARGHGGTEVALQPTLGTVTPSPVVLDEDGSATAMLRSAGIGNSRITASDPPFQEGVANVGFVWPIAFAIATLMGALVGALLSRGARQHPLRTLCVGILSAIVVCVAHAIGVTTQTWGTPSGAAGEALFFFIAAVAGYLGRSAVAKLAST